MKPAARVSRLAFLAAAVVGARAGAGCAADPGDPAKTFMAAGAPGEGSGSSPEAAMTMSADDKGSGQDSGSGGATGGGATGGGADDGAAGVAPEASEIQATDATVGMTSVPDAAPDGAACLVNIPSSCPNCATQNANDKPVCEQYIQCFITNACDPAAACGSNTGICGVNTVGGGEAPYGAAVATYDCACP